MNSSQAVFVHKESYNTSRTTLISEVALTTETTRMSNRNKEAYYFEMFRKDYQLPLGTLEASDRPDIILNGQRRIGIEITNFYLDDGALPSSEQVQRKARQGAILQAEQSYLTNGGKKLAISFSFDKAFPIQDVRELSQRVARLGWDVVGRKPGTVGKDVFKKEVPELSFVYLHERRHTEQGWRLVQGHSSPSMSIAKLREIVAGKEELSKSYQHCDAYWLLVVVDFLDRAQDQEIRISGFEKIKSTVFERVVVYKTHFGHVYEAK